jgi:hypothetical protein
MTNFWMAVFTVVMAMVVSFIATWLLGFEDPIEPAE